MNVARLQRVRAEILDDPASFEMDDYVTPKYDERNEHCGTALCIGARAALDAGLIVLRSTPRPHTALVFYDIADAAAGRYDPLHIEPLFTDALELSKPQSDRLFHVNAWPKQFRQPFEQSVTPTERATIAAKRIDHFVRTGGLD